MNNKIRSGLWISVVFITLLSLISAAGAADLKALQDKYRISYNNFTRALKEGADQKVIDQLSEQCKADYEEYQKVLNHNTKEEEKKPKPVKVQPASGPKPVIKNAAKPEKTIQSPVTYKQIKINVNGVSKSIRVPFFDYKSLKPNKVVPAAPIKPSRIGAPIRIAEKAPFTYTQLPEIPNSIKDPVKEAGIQMLNDLKKATTSSPAGNVMGLTYTICSKYSNYPDLCAAARLCFIEFNMAKYPADTSFQGVPDWQENEERIKLQEMNHEYKKLLSELDEAYSKAKDPICAAVKQAVDSRLATVDKNMEENKTRMYKYIEKLQNNIKKWDTDMEKYASPNNPYKNLESVPSKDSCQARYNEIFSMYSELRWTYKALRDFDGYKDINTKYETRYIKDFPQSVTFYYYKPDGKVYPCTREDLKKDFRYYSYFKQQYVEALSVFCESEVKDATFESISEEIDNVRKYIEEDNSKKEENKTDYLVRNVKDQLNKSQSYPAISSCYFTGNEDVKNPNRVFDVKDLITLRAKVSYDMYLYPINQQKLTSAISKRNKEVTLKKCAFNYGYYAKFQPNETDDPADSSVNIINNDKNEFNNSIALFHGEPPAQYIAPATALINLYDNPYFKNRFGHSDVNSIIECNQTNHGVFRDTYEFIKSGGAEKIYDKNLKNFVLVRHQANWFVIYGHGNPNTGSIGEKWNRPNAIVVRPTMTTVYTDPENNQVTMVEGLIKRDGTSEYNENMHVLMLAACDCLHFESQATIPNITNWHNVLPTGTILGYRNSVLAHEVIRAIEKMNEHLKNNPSTNSDVIISAWMQYNLQIASGSLMWFGQGLYGATAIKGTTRTCSYIDDSVVTINCRYRVYSYRFRGQKSFNF